MWFRAARKAPPGTVRAHGGGRRGRRASRADGKSGIAPVAARAEPGTVIGRSRCNLECESRTTPAGDRALRNAAGRRRAWDRGGNLT